jgi:hypothetical protein
VENPLGYSLHSLLLKGEEPCPLILAHGFLNHPESFIKIADVVFKKTKKNGVKNLNEHKPHPNFIHIDIFYE